MIIIKQGSLLDSKEDIIGHQTNCQGYMGRGIALEIRNKYPNVYNEYRKYVNNNKGNLLGTIQLLRANENKIVCNLFGQDNISKVKKMTNEKALENCLYSLKIYAQQVNMSIALPKGMGCVNGGGNWEDVYKIIDKVFSNYIVYLYDYK